MYFLFYILTKSQFKKYLWCKLMKAYLGAFHTFTGSLSTDWYRAPATSRQRCCHDINVPESAFTMVFKNGINLLTRLFISKCHGLCLECYFL